MAATGVTAGSPGAGPPAQGAAYAVELRGITKRFPGVVANRDIELRVRRGEVHAIVGENGAGKSTLMKTLYGMHRPDEGTILLDGREVHFRSPADAIDAGIGMVHQHFMLADNFTVLENIVLGSEPTRGGRLDFAEARRRIKEISDRYALDLDPDELVEHLGVGDRQRVEIAKVLYRGATMLILDEPTAVLVPQEVDELFGNLAELKREGLTVIFISHKLDEVRKVADSITVIRRGTTVGDGRPEDDDRAAAGRDDGRLRTALAGDADLDGPRRPSSSSCDGVDRGDAGRTAGGRRRRPRRPRGRGRRHRRRRGQRPGRAGRRDHGPASARGRHRRVRRSRTSAPGAPATGARRASASSPRTGTARACCSRRRSGRTGSSVTRRRPPAAKGWFIDRKAARTDTAADHEGLRRPRPGAGRRWPSPCPAATSRS